MARVPALRVWAGSWVVVIVVFIIELDFMRHFGKEIGMKVRFVGTKVSF